MVKKGDVVTVVDNKTGEETTGVIIEYTPSTIKLVKTFNAKEVRFK